MEITVSLGKRSYPVFINDKRPLPGLCKELFPSRPFACVTNTTIAGLYKNRLAQWNDELGPVMHIIEDGEQHKNIDTWQNILDTLLNSSLDRRAVIIAFGGGVVGDIAGFAAAAFLRGVDYVQVPTTLLAMVDSSVGGKTAVDHQSGKNRIGAFHQPRMVYIDTAFLDTLEKREFIAGYAEVFKYAFIGGSDMFSFIDKNHEKILSKDSKLLLEAIERSIRIKAGIVSEDETEVSGRRSLLNFGHTFAHALETYYNYEKLLHGEAVWWGMGCACDLGKRAGTIPQQSQGACDSLCAKLLPMQLPSKPSAEKLYAGMFTDKKVQGGKIRFVLPAAPGESVLRDDIGESDVLATLEAMINSV
jgi:3-dehydroquinate synthase